MTIDGGALDFNIPTYRFATELYVMNSEKCTVLCTVLQQYSNGQLGIYTSTTVHHMAVPLQAGVVSKLLQLIANDTNAVK
jgi:hypothetical protein